MADFGKWRSSDSPVSWQIMQAERLAEWRARAKANGRLTDEEIEKAERFAQRMARTSGQMVIECLEDTLAAIMAGRKLGSDGGVE
jgi:hypothetical protein